MEGNPTVLMYHLPRHHPEHRPELAVQLSLLRTNWAVRILYDADVRKSLLNQRLWDRAKLAAPAAVQDNGLSQVKRLPLSNDK